MDIKERDTKNTPEQKRKTVRKLVKGAYDLQDLRLATGSRLVANFRSKLGIAPDEEVEDDMKKKIMSELQSHHKRLTDGIAKVTRRPNYDFEDGIIDSYVELRLVDRYLRLVEEENQAFKDVGDALEGVPIWDEFLEGVDGVGNATGGCIVSELDPHKAPYPSSFWKYCGLDVVDGEGKSNKKEHMETVEYVNSDGEKDTRKSLGYNPFIKTKLMGVLAVNLLRNGSDYRKHYDQYKHRKETDPECDWTGGHIEMAARRKMIKQLLKDIHLKWRDLEGLSVPLPYHAAKQGNMNHVSETEKRLGITDPKRPKDDPRYGG